MVEVRDNASDRQLGEKWERNFGRLAGDHGRCFTPHQIGRPNQSASAYFNRNGWHRLLLPDATVWSAPGEHHEIKHKDATRTGMYGLERYRLDALLAFASECEQPVFYTIHDWRLAGASSSREEMRNDIADWRVADVRALAAHVRIERDGPTWRNGKSAEARICYWPVSLWQPLAELWSPAGSLAA